VFLVADEIARAVFLQRDVPRRVRSVIVGESGELHDVGVRSIEPQRERARVHRGKGTEPRLRRRRVEILSAVGGQIRVP